MLQFPAQALKFLLGMVAGIDIGAGAVVERGEDVGKIAAKLTEGIIRRQQKTDFPRLFRKSSANRLNDVFQSTVSVGQQNVLVGPNLC